MDIHVPYAQRRALANVVTKFWIPYGVSKFLASTKLLAYQGPCAMEYLANKRRKWNRLYSKTWNVACERNCRMTKITTNYAAVQCMWPVKEHVYTKDQNIFPSTLENESLCHFK